MKLNKIFIVPILLFFACGKPKPFCGEKCVYEKLKTFNKVSRVYIDGVDKSGPYYNNDSVFKEIEVFNYGALGNKNQYSLSFVFGIRWNNRLVFNDCIRSFSLKQKTIVFEKSISVDGSIGELEYVVCNSIPDSSGRCNYIPFENVFLSKDVSEIRITEIEKDFITWEYIIKGREIKLIFKQ